MRFISNNRAVTGAALAMVAGLTLYGCQDFLNKSATPEGTLDQGTLSTPSGVEGTLIAAYRQLDCTSIHTGDWGCAVSNWAFGSVPTDDAYEGSEFNDQPPVEALELYHWSTSAAHAYLNDKWTALYEGVSRANAAINLLKIVEPQGGMSPEQINGITGEAIFLRAHFQFEAWRFWGNLPYYRENDKDFKKANEPSAAVVADLLKDLDSAIKILPDEPRNGDVGRATKWTAMAYK